MTPRQFGPMSRIRPAAGFEDLAFELRPAGPISLNPAEMMIAPDAGLDALGDYPGTLGAG